MRITIACTDCAHFTVTKLFVLKVIWDVQACSPKSFYSLYLVFILIVLFEPPSNDYVTSFGCVRCLVIKS